MGPAYDPAPGIERFLAGTPPILELTAVRSGVELIAEAGMAQIAAQDPRSSPTSSSRCTTRGSRRSGFTLASPRDAATRGGHVSLAHPDGWQICRALIERANVVPDFRQPDRVRFGLPALYTRFADVYEAAKRTKDLVALGAHREIKAPPPASRSDASARRARRRGSPSSSHLAHHALAGDEVAPRAARQLHGRRVRRDVVQRDDPLLVVDRPALDREHARVEVEHGRGRARVERRRRAADAQQPQVRPVDHPAQRLGIEQVGDAQRVGPVAVDRRASGG